MLQHSTLLNRTESNSRIFLISACHVPSGFSLLPISGCQCSVTYPQHAGLRKAAGTPPSRGMPTLCESLSVENKDKVPPVGEIRVGDGRVVRYPPLAVAYGTGPQPPNRERPRPPPFSTALAGMPRAARLPIADRDRSRLGDKGKMEGTNGTHKSPRMASTRRTRCMHIVSPIIQPALTHRIILTSF